MLDRRLSRLFDAVFQEQAHRQLINTGEFTKEWFDGHMPRCAAEGSCNFTTIGGVLTLLGVAVYESRGVYRILRRS